MKMNIFFASIVILCMMSFSVAAQEPDWLAKLKQAEWMNKVGKIKLLKTSRAEAEQILGKPDVLGDGETNFIEYYSIENGRVTITYTTKECSSKNGKVNKDMIKEINFRLKQEILFPNLKIPTRKFEKSIESDAPSIHLYKNEKYGILFDVQFKKLVSVTFFPPASEKFDCPK